MRGKKCKKKFPVKFTEVRASLDWRRSQKVLALEGLMADNWSTKTKGKRCNYDQEEGKWCRVWEKGGF
ncbi:MAG: hypothetical protein HW382_43 [Deltaproteobacteria bacterium]|nr:hypothetical protein [Deltaproteobacteria bacterium]